MDYKSWLGAIELIAVFGLFIVFCWLQLRNLDKLDRADEEREKLEVDKQDRA